MVRARQIIANTNPSSPISEQYRTIRTNLQFAAVDKEIKSFIVTSAEPSDGKSITAANMAVVYAQQGKTVLLIDADLRKPTIHFTFRVDNVKGLTNYLVRERSVQDIITPSRLQNLDLITSGPIPPNPAELLGSKAMTMFLQEVYGAYDIIIFDTPPVLAVADAAILGSHVDGALLVAYSKKTKLEAVKQAKERLEQAHTKILGSVLNGKELKKSHYYYYGNDV
ncbi:CpsD/CapB family tyrosine-protein kinase [Bacillaceae bacterium S4-13-56]